MRIRIALVALALLVAACGDDDTAGAETSEPATTAAPTTAAPTTEAATTTAAPTTTEAPTTTVDPAAAIAALVEPYVGAYEGSWTNTTFGSEGPIAATVAFDGAALTITLDIGGFVFGAFDPDPEEFVLTLADLAAATEGTISSSTFGEMTVTETADGFELYSDTVPDPGIATILVTITPGAANAEMAYVIEFAGGGGAEGVATVARTG